MESKINEFIENISYRFINRALLEQALTHRSYASEQDSCCDDNERLEFLGDAIVGACVAQELFCLFPNYTEGQLSLIKSYLVSSKVLAQLADQINLGSVLYLGVGEEKTGGRMRKRLLCNTFEAIIGAIFLDSGYQSAYQFLWPLMRPILDNLDTGMIKQNVKNVLQQHCHKHFTSQPKYVTKSIVGPPHKRTYTIELYIEGNIISTGCGSSKKKASINAAHNALTQLKVLPK